MKRLAKVPCLVLCILLFSTGLAAEDKAPMGADEILSRALQRAKQISQANHEGSLRFDYLSVSQELDEDKQVKKEESKLYRNVPVDGIPFQRLVEKDGEPLQDGELRDEREREQEFRHKVAEGKDPRQENENRMEFDERLTGRYHFTLEGQETLDGFNCWVLSFRPREGDLPDERRVDPALNNSVGKLWITRDLFEIARAQFELVEPVSMWWGIVGKIGKLKGSIDRRPVRDGLWMPESFHLYMKGRIFFSGLHRRLQVLWSNFEGHQDGVLR